MNTIVELEIIIIIIQILTIPAVIFGKAAYLHWQSLRWERKDRKLQEGESQSIRRSLSTK